MQRLTHWPSTILGVASLIAGIAVLWSPLSETQKVAVAGVLFAAGTTGIAWKGPRK